MGTAVHDRMFAFGYSNIHIVRQFSSFSHNHSKYRMNVMIQFQIIDEN